MVFNGPMKERQTRREFLQHSALAAAGLASAALVPAVMGMEPVARSGQPKLMLSLAAYSFRDYFKEGKGTGTKPVDPSKLIELPRFLDYCAEQQCAAEVTAYYFPASVNADYLLNLKRQAFLRGVPISGTAVGNTFTHPAGVRRDEQIKYVKQWIDRAAILGAPHIRVFAGELQQGTTKAEAKKFCIAAMEECCAYAGQKGVILGLENHGGIVGESADLLDIIKAVQSPWCGINLDTGNFRTDDPYRDLELCAPYAVNVQFKAEIWPRGQEEKSPGDMKRVVRILRSAKYQGFMALEYEAAEDAWSAVPRLLKEMRELIAG